MLWPPALPMGRGGSVNNEPVICYDHLPYPGRREGREGSVNNEPAICNDHLSYPGRWHWRVGSWMRGAEGGGGELIKQNV